MDLADASLVLLASHIGIREILTVDRRDFEVYRLLDGREIETTPIRIKLRRR